MSGIIGANNQFGEDFGHPNPTTQGTIVAIYFYKDIGCALGSLFVFFFGEAIGRKRMIMSGAVTMLAGTSETCRGKDRGKLVCLNSTVTIIGLVIAYWLDYGMSFVDGPIQWRLPIGFQAFFALCLFLQGLVLPDSPRWLIAHGYKDEGAQVIARLEERDSTDHPDVIHVVQDIEASLALESAGGPFKYKELLAGGKIQNFRRICLCIGINIMQQFTGANMIK
ncbi:hypothetical protein H0H92_015211 [Tricholoma furcatifolium]|nr:hypothetical protein H0H92_015211 [Tricholoma furcatifolium]